MGLSVRGPKDEDGADASSKAIVQYVCEISQLLFV